MPGFINKKLFRYVFYNGLFAILPYLIIFFVKMFQTDEQSNSLIIALFLLFGLVSYASNFDSGLIRYCQKMSQLDVSDKLKFHGPLHILVLFFLIPVLFVYFQIAGVKEINSSVSVYFILILSILIVSSQGFLNLFSNSYDVSRLYEKSFLLKLVGIVLPLAGFLIIYLVEANLYFGLLVFFVLRLIYTLFSYYKNKQIKLFNLNSTFRKDIFSFSVVGSISNFAFLSLERHTSLNFLHGVELQNYLVTSDLITKATFLSGAFAQLSLNNSISGTNEIQPLKGIIQLSLLSAVIYTLSICLYDYIFTELIVFADMFLLAESILIVFFSSISQNLLIKVFITKFGQQKVLGIQAATFVVSILVFLFFLDFNSFSLDQYIVMLLFKTVFELILFLFFI